MAAASTKMCALLLTDVEGSTALWEKDRRGTAVALERHDAIAAATVVRHQGTLVKPRGEGDSLFCVFDRASDAVAAALDLQIAFREVPASGGSPLRVRIAIHTGEMDAREGDYYGPAVNRCARIRSAAHGGQVLVSHAVQQLASEALPVGSHLVDLGVHRLRDLSRPERIFQLAHPDLPSVFPPLRTLDHQVHNLPVLLTSFVGREREVSEVLALFEKTRLLTLVGVGGTGKTRMALEVAAQVADRFSDGVCFVDLAPLRDAHLTERALLSAIQETNPDLAGTLDAALADRELLLVLDNCEHLLRATCACADRALRISPRLKVIATSRRPFGLSGEQIYPVPPMNSPAPGSKGLVRRLFASDAGSLFLERARAVQPTFDLHSANAEDVAAVCAALDGIPLAIELAAARLRVLSPGQIRERLQDRFALLTSSASSGDERHRTLRGALDWSFDLLSEPEQVLLARLSVFRGGWSLEAAEAVCCDPEFPPPKLLDVLQGLVEASLVLYMPSESGPGRYRMLESVREYAAEKLVESPQAPTRSRHAEWCADLVRAAEAEFTGSDQARWFERIEEDLDNVRAGIAYLLESREGALGALQLVLGLRTFWIVRGHFEEARAGLLESLARAEDLDPALRARAENLLGILALLSGDLDEARLRLAGALELRRALEDWGGQAATLSNLGIVERYSFRFQEALAFFDESVRLYRRLEQPNETGYALLNLGCAYFETGQFEMAEATYAECLTLMTRLQDQSGLSQLRANMADVRLSLDDPETAAAHILAAIHEAEACGYVQCLGDGFHALARLALYNGNTEVAAIACGAAKRVAVEGGAKPTLIEGRRAAQLRSKIVALAGEAKYRSGHEQGFGVPEKGRFQLARSLLDRLTETSDS
ncbi:MAG: tetratricopeptide repeat protein [Armatimonadetes bacterium]|nr:tetratricopeptide repeat protein [Armatimonadota bacterium]